MKSPQMEKFLDNVTKTTFGRTRRDANNTNTCVCCGKDASTFRDELSRREYQISKMCQKCQDSVFG